MRNYFVSIGAHKKLIAVSNLAMQKKAVALAKSLDVYATPVCFKTLTSIERQNAGFVGYNLDDLHIAMLASDWEMHASHDKEAEVRQRITLATGDTATQKRVMNILGINPL